MIFIVGTGRCGSSLIHELMALHQDMAFISNFDDRLALFDSKGCWNNAIFRAMRGRWTKKGGGRFAPSEAYRLISRRVSPIYANSCRDLVAEDASPWLKERFRDFFYQRWLSQGKPYVLHKYTGWSRVGFFAEIFPEAKFIHIVRDGRSVVNSWLKMPWWGGYRGDDNWLWGELTEKENKSWQDAETSFPALAAIGWNKLMNSYEVSGENMAPARMLTCRFEDFIQQPFQFMVNLQNWLELPLSKVLTSEFLGSRVRTTHHDAYLKELSKNQIACIENQMHQILHKYKYL